MTPRSFLVVLAAALALAASARAADPALPDPVKQSIAKAVKNNDAAIRQMAVDQTLTWVKASVTLVVNWATLQSMTYDDSRSGSKTDANDPAHIKVLIGRDPFGCEGDVYSTIRHELVHVEQQQNQSRVIAQGWGYQEMLAYLWEIENAASTGLDKCDKGSGASRDRSRGVTRALDGVFRYASVMAGEMQQHKSNVSQQDQDKLNGRVACAMRGNQAIVNDIFPQVKWDDVPACSP